MTDNLVVAEKIRALLAEYAAIARLASYIFNVRI